MMGIVETNVAAILTIMMLWCTLVWAATYMYMSFKVRDRDNRIEVLDWYIYEIEHELESIINEVTR